jgi:hypothetical protein
VGEREVFKLDNEIIPEERYCGAFQAIVERGGDSMIQDMIEEMPGHLVAMVAYLDSIDPHTGEGFISPDNAHWRGHINTVRNYLERVIERINGYDSEEFRITESDARTLFLAAEFHDVMNGNSHLDREDPRYLEMEEHGFWGSILAYMWTGNKDVAFIIEKHLDDGHSKFKDYPVLLSIFKGCDRLAALGWEGVYRLAYYYPSFPKSEDVNNYESYFSAEILPWLEKDVTKQEYARFVLEMQKRLTWVFGGYSPIRMESLNQIPPKKLIGELLGTYFYGPDIFYIPYVVLLELEEDTVNPYIEALNTLTGNQPPE